MTKRNRFLTTLLTISVAFVMLASVVYIAKESHHDCVGDNCAICHQINTCEHFLKDLGFGGAAAAAFLSLTVFLLECVRTYAVHTASLTLVSLKVKLSN
jgi:hypothetical protein